jgi:transcriptional regulator with XRE-family HTH domain
LSRYGEIFLIIQLMRPDMMVTLLILSKHEITINFATRQSRKEASITHQYGIAHNPLVPTKLYSTLKPFGVGKPKVESVASLFERLSLAHTTTPGKLFDDVVVPLLRKKYLTTYVVEGGTGFYKASSMLNGPGQAASDFTQALKTLTGQDYTGLTLIPWGKMLTPRGLLRPVRASCPRCYDEQRKQGPIYDWLLWAISPVNVCPEHGCLLATKCPKCGRTSYILDRYTIPGRCTCCGSWLGDGKWEESPPDCEAEWENWVARNVGELLAAMPTIYEFPDALVLQKAIARCPDFFGENSAEFSRRCGISKSQFSEWASGKHLPSLPMLLLLANQSGQTLLQLVTGKCDTGGQPIPRINIPQLRKEGDAKIMKRRPVQDGCEQGKPQTVKAVAESLGINRRTLYELSAEISLFIGSRYKKYLSQQKERRNELLSQRVRKVTDALLYKGIFPSARRVQAEAGDAALLRSPHAKQVWKTEIIKYRR